MIVSENKVQSATPTMICAGIEACDGQLHSGTVRKVYEAMIAAAWRPIGTAPDNEYVDLWVANYNGEAVRIDRGQRACDFRRVDGDWRNAQGGRCESNGSDGGRLHGIKATHWMPRPTAPHMDEQR
jgi:hypothetical protein